MCDDNLWKDLYKIRKEEYAALHKDCVNQEKIVTVVCFFPENCRLITIQDNFAQKIIEKLKPEKWVIIKGEVLSIEM